MNATLFNGLSGILTHQVGLDSVSNNIANVNTTGYRANIPQFETLFAKSMSYINSSSPINNDFEHGVTVSSNAISNKNGSYKSSDGEFDIAYAGKGWFVVGTQKSGSFDLQNPTVAATQKNYFTRDGSFSRDSEGYLVNASGYYLYGIDLGKISETGTFNASRNEAADNLALSGSKLSPLRIPEDLYYQPTVTTQVGVAVNLNKSATGTGVNEVFLNADGSFNLEAFLAQDMNALMDSDLKLIDALNYKDLTITTTLPSGKTESHTFTYGGSGSNGFKTVGELKDLIEVQTGLTLDITRDSSGNPAGCTMSLRNDTLYDMKISVSGKLGQKLGLNGNSENFSSGAVGAYNASATNYEVGAYVMLDNVVYRRTTSVGNSDPHTDTANWERIDSSAIEGYNTALAYEVGNVVEQGGVLYRRIGTAGNSDPATNPTDWENLGASATGSLPNYVEGTTYNTNDIVSHNGILYKRTGASGASDPYTDSANWTKVGNDSRSTTKFAVPSYTSGVEVYSTDGTKYVLQSTYYLLDSGNDGVGERWEVRSAIYDSTGKSMVSAAPVVHEMTFNNGVASAASVAIPFDGGTITYNPAQTEDGKLSTNYTYVESSVKAKSQDGSPAGRLDDIGVDSNGRIILTFTNGKSEVMGRVGLAAFVNDQGLQKVGGNMFQMTSISVNGGQPVYSSGAPILAWDETGQLKFGKVLDSMLETSNVDIGAALTELIVLQRGYSFNAKAFTTGDELIKEAIGLKK